MRILIIGASGFIGRSVLRYAKRAGHITVGTMYSTRGGDMVRFDMTHDDIRDAIPPDFLSANDTCAVICSAVTKIDECWKDKGRSYEINVNGTIRTLDKLNALGVKTVFLSSEAVFDGTRGYYDETIPTSPLNEYGRQKVEVEEHILSRVHRGLVIRLSMIVGDSPKDAHLFAVWLERVRRHDPIICIAGQIFSPTFVEDVAQGIVTALERKLEGLFHLANPEFFLRDELARQFVCAVGADADIVVKPLEEFTFPEKRALKTYLDGTRFAKATGMRFTSMREVLDKLRQNLYEGGMLNSGSPHVSG